jgi:hypothetical protein
VYHDHYRRTPDGWKFTERVYEIKYIDTTLLAGSAPHAAPSPGGIVIGSELKGPVPLSREGATNHDNHNYAQ